MTSREFRDRLLRRTARIPVEVTPDVLGALEAYYRLLAQWNRTINLTALRLDSPTDETFDRLIVEPLAATRLLPAITGSMPAHWIDLGSGGGSPAIPMKLVASHFRLNMVESKIRKAAFLRETVRALNLQNAAVTNVRFSELLRAQDMANTCTLVTARAVRWEPTLDEIVHRLLCKGGQFHWFTSHPASRPIVGFSWIDTVQIVDSKPKPAFLARFEKR